VRSKLVVLVVLLLSLSFLLAIALGAEISTISLTSSSGMNLSSDNITVSYTTTGANTVIADWRRNATSIAVLNLPFDVNISENTSGAVRDYSTYGHNGTLGDGISADMPVWTDSCIVGGCYVFDGINDYIQVEEHVVLNISANISFGAWAKVLGDGSTSGSNYILAKGVHTTQPWGSYGIIHNRPDNEIRCDLGLEGEDKIYLGSGVVKNSSDDWFHVLCTYDGDEFKIYIDGDLKNNVSFSGTINNELATFNGVRIGAWNPAFWRAFNGLVDEVLIINRTLSSEQIKAVYNAGLAGHAVETLLSQETKIGDVWSVALTPINNSDVVESATMLSNNLTIQSAQTTYLNAFLHNPENNAEEDTYTAIAFEATINSTNNNIINATLYTNETGSWHARQTRHAGEISYNMPGLVALYHFNNEGGYGENESYVIDWSGNNNHLFCSSNCGTYNRSGGKFSGAFLANDDLHLSTSGASNLNNLETMTIMFWIYKHAEGSNDVLGMYEEGESSTWYLWVPPSNEIRFSYNGGNNIDTNGNAPLNQWIHYAVVHDGINDIDIIYIDGVQVNNVTGRTQDIPASTAELVFGGTQEWPNEFNGYIDEFAAYNRALNETEIKNVYNYTKRTFEPVFKHNFSGEGTYSWNVLGEDNTNSTAFAQNNRTIHIQNIIDTTAPLIIEFVNPTPDHEETVSSRDTHTFNISVETTANLTEFVWDWNNTNFTFYDDSLLLMMNFNNRSSLGETDGFAKDVSMYAGNGTINDAVYAQGKYGRALSFDGSTAYVDVGNDSLYSLGQTHTIAMWVYRDFEVCPAGYMGLLGKSDYGQTKRSYGFEITPNCKFRMVINNNGTIAGYSYFDSIEDVENNEWTFVAGTYDGATMRIYLNGVQSNTLSVSSKTPFVNDVPLFIGAHRSSGSPMMHFEGLLDEVMMWNRTLAANEIKELYTSNLHKFNESQWYFTSNKTGLDAGNYTYSGYVKNELANNQTETRSLEILDYGLMDMSFITPTPADDETRSTVDEILITVLTITNKLTKYIWNWNATNTTQYDDSLLLMMNFDNRSSLGENAGFAKDVSLYNRNGTINNAVYTQGTYEQALSFDGSTAYVDMGNDSLYSLGQNFTLSAWIYRNFTDCSPYHGILGKIDYGQNKRSYGLEILNDCRFRLLINDIGAASGNRALDSVADVPNDAWTHVIGTYDGATMRVYLNGVQDNTLSANSITPLVNDVPLYIGAQRSSGSPVMHFQGLIDEVRIWNRTLTADEIQELYNSNLYKYNETQWYFTSDKTGLGEGQYRYYAYAENDAATIKTEMRTLNIYGIELFSPLNDSYYTTSEIVFNISSSRELDWCGLSVNGGVNITMSLDGDLFGASYVNSSMPDGNYNFVVTCNDTNGELGTSDNYYFSVDTINPLISFELPTPNHEGAVVDDIFVNVSSSDVGRGDNMIATFIDFNNTLISWWRMDDYNETHIIDYTGNINGIFEGGLSSENIIPGYLGKAMRFDGSSNYHVNLGLAEEINAIETGDFTISAWIKNNAATSNHQPILVKRTYGANNWGFDLILGNRLRFHYDTTSLGSGFLGLNDDTWHNVLVRKQGDYLQFYVDGQSDPSGPYYHPLINLSNSNNLYIGERIPLSSPKFEGLIDDVMVFSRALSEEEILGLYANTASKLLEINYTDLEKGDYLFKAFTQDRAGNINETETRVVTLNKRPIMESVRINPEFYATYSDTLSGYCQATDPYAVNITYYYRWYLNGVLNKTGVTPQNYTSSLEVNIANISSAQTEIGQEWMLSCLAHNGEINTTWIHSASTEIVDTGLHLSFFNPTPDDGETTVSNKETILNVSINTVTALTNFTWNWNETNYTLYDESLVLFMNFDNRSELGENDTFVRDLSLYGNDATVSGTAYWSSHSRYNGAYNLSGVTGSSQINAGNDSSLQLNTSFSFFAWVRRMGNTGDATWQPIVTKDGDVAEYWFGFSNGDQLALSLWYGPSLTGTRSNFYSGTAGRILDDDWHHVGATYNGSHIQFYVDGETVHTASYSQILHKDTSPVLIGRTLRWNYVFNGFIDDVMVFNKAIPEDIIQQLYVSNLYKFNETQWHFTSNKTGLDEGNYAYYAYAENLADSNQTETRTLGIIVPITIDTCQNISNPGIYQVTNNVESNATCIEIRTDDVVLDCQDHTITFSLAGESGTRGILAAGDNITIQNCNVLDGNWSGASGRYGVSFLNSARNSVLYNNTINVSNARALAMDGGSNYNTFSNNVISSNTGFAAYLSSISHCTFFNNTFRSVLYDSIVQWFGTNNTYDSNTIRGRELGMALSGTTATLIKNNVVWGERSNGIYLHSGANDVTIYNNTVNSTTSYGIFSNILTGINITGNTVYANVTTAIYALGSSDIVIDDNVAINNVGSGYNGYGIHVVNSPNALIRRNTAVGGGRGIFLQYSSGLGNYTVTDNDISSLLWHGLVVRNLHHSRFYRNNISAHWEGIHMSLISSNNIFINNTVKTTHQSGGLGLYSWNAVNNTFIGNNFSNNVNGVFLSSDASGFTFINNSFVTNVTNALGVRLITSLDTEFRGNTIITTGSGSTAVHMGVNTSHTLFQDCVNISGVEYDVYVGGNVANLTFLNCSYNISKEEVAGSDSELFRKWWFAAKVVDTAALPVRDAQFTMYADSGDAVFSSLTDVAGHIQKVALTEYTVHNTTRQYQNVVRAIVSKQNYVATNVSFNLSLEQNIFETIVLSLAKNNLIEVIELTSRLKKLKQAVVNESVDAGEAIFIASYDHNFSVRGLAKMFLHVSALNMSNSSSFYFEVIPLENISKNFSEIVVQVPFTTIVLGNYSNTTQYSVVLKQNDSSIVELNTSIVSRNGSVFLEFTSQKLGEFFVNTLPVAVYDKQLAFEEESIYEAYVYSSFEGEQEGLYTQYRLGMFGLLCFLLVFIFVAPPKRVIFLMVFILLVVLLALSLWAIPYIPPLV
jgi:nitrous oxidase accessory protein NosD